MAYKYLGVAEQRLIKIFMFGGNVGIGTTSPASKLEVNGGGNIIKVYNNVGEYNNSGILLQNIYGTGSSEVSLTASANQMLIGAQGQTIGDYGGYLNVTSAHPMKFLINNNERMRIDGSGNIGIGTTSPKTTLQLGDASSGVSDNTGELTLAKTVGGGHRKFKLGLDANYGLSIGDYGTNASDTYSPYITIQYSGNVLIGKTSQTNTAYKLDINGSARANEVVVNTTGADFVFYHKYKLPKLSEVKTYIDNNHHLSEIPSADDMKRDGLNVGEINTKLLQKVEELTLYLIEKDKQVNNLQDEMSQLKEQMVILTKALTKN